VVVVLFRDGVASWWCRQNILFFHSLWNMV